MSYGVFQDYYTTSWPLRGRNPATGVIGTTFNGVVYLLMPFLFAALTQRWARYRHAVAMCGVVINCLSFILSSYSTWAWHVVATQGVFAPIGCALIYSPRTSSLGEWYATDYRAVAYGIVLSSKNIVGSACPFMLRYLLDHCGFSIALRIWASVAAGSSLFAMLLVPGRPASITSTEARSRRVPWNFLMHQTFYIYSFATIMQSAGYGLPQTYLPTYAHEAASLSHTSATLLLTVFNIPGILFSSFFGFLSSNKRFPMSASTTTSISAISATLSVFLLWGLAPRNSMALLTLFAIIFGFFTSGYSATWGGVLNEMEGEAASRNEAVDTGVLYGLLNGARGVGYASGGLAAVLLPRTSGAGGLPGSGYAAKHFPIIVFTGLCSIFGGWSILWHLKKIHMPGLACSRKS